MQNKYSGQKRAPHLVADNEGAARKKDDDRFAVPVVAAGLFVTGSSGRAGILPIVRAATTIVVPRPYSPTSVDIRKMTTGPWPSAAIVGITAALLFVGQSNSVGAPEVIVGKHHKSRQQSHHKGQESDQLEQPPGRAVK